MKLFKFSILCFGLQVLFAYFMLNLFGASDAFFFVAMALSAHMVIEITAKSSLEVDHGFMALVVVYFVVEVYFFIAALATVLEPLSWKMYSMMFDAGPSLMLFLTLLSFVSSGLNPIIKNTGTFGDVVGRFIYSAYNGVVSLPLHRTGN
jgi:hypothetical protein